MQARRSGGIEHASPQLDQLRVVAPQEQVLPVDEIQHLERAIELAGQDAMAEFRDLGAHVLDRGPGLGWLADRLVVVRDS